MATIFTRIIEGELPGRFVWRDERAVAFLTIEPLSPGHVLVVPIQEIDHWIDLDPHLAEHLFTVAQAIGKAQQRAFTPTRIGMMIVGIEVPHVHLHTVPIDAIADLDFSKADRNPKPEALDQAAERIRVALRELLYEEVSD